MHTKAPTSPGYMPLQRWFSDFTKAELRAVLEGDASEPPLSPLDESEAELPRRFGDYELIEELAGAEWGLFTARTN